MIDFKNADAFEALREYDDNHFDLLIADPPYGSKNIQGGYSAGKGHEDKAKQKDYHKGLWTQDAPGKDHFDELFRVSKNQVLFGANHYINNLIPDKEIGWEAYHGHGCLKEKVVKIGQRNLPTNLNASCWLVWDKRNGKVSFADCELAWTSFPGSVRIFRHRWSGMLQENMKNKQNRIHPTEKPIELYKWILSKFAKPGWSILDPYAGSLSIGIACHDLDFDLTAFEIEPEYYELAIERLESHKTQYALKFPSKDKDSTNNKQN